MKLPNIYLICCKSEHATHKSNKNLKLGFTRPNHVSIMRSIVWRGGRVRSNAPDLKSGDGLNRPGVRIPPSPPYYWDGGFKIDIQSGARPAHNQFI